MKRYINLSLNEKIKVSKQNTHHTLAFNSLKLPIMKKNIQTDLKKTLKKCLPET